MNLKKKILTQTLAASLVLALILGAVFLFSLFGIRRSALNISGELGGQIAEVSADALENQLAYNMALVAQEMALALDEKLVKIEYLTRAKARAAGAIYTWMASQYPAAEETARFSELAQILRQGAGAELGVSSRMIAGGYIVDIGAGVQGVHALPQNLSLQENSWYKRDLESRSDIYWSAIYVDGQRGKPVVSAAVPFFEHAEGAGGEDGGHGEQNFRGTLANTLSISHFFDSLDFELERYDGYIFLLDREGLNFFSSGAVNVIACDDGQLVGKNFLHSGDWRLRYLGSRMTEGGAGVAEIVMDGVPVVVAWATAPTLGWSLGVAVPVLDFAAPVTQVEMLIQTLTAQASSDINRQIFLFAAVALAALLASMIAIALFFIRFTANIAGPINALYEGVQEVSAGNFNRLVSVKTGDELEELASSFNIMTGRLQEQILKISRDTMEKERMSVELDVAARIQASMLPRKFPPFAGRRNDFDLFAAVYPAKAVGGDFYDFFFIDEDHFAMLIADVSGQGIPAAIFMAIAKTLIKNNLKNVAEPNISMNNINAQLCKINSETMFVTVWLGVLELPTGRLKFINAGHNPPLVKMGGGGFKFLQTPPDTVLAAVESTSYQCREVLLEDGDVVFLYTDGITEATDAQGDFFGAKRLLSFMNANADLPPDALLPAVRADLAEYSLGAAQFDDITMLALRYNREKGGAESLRLLAEAQQLQKLMEFIGKNLDGARCPKKIRSQIELAAEEIFINIGKYAYNNYSGEVLVRSKADPAEGGGVFSITFVDWGEPFNPLEVEEPDLNGQLEMRKIGGLGILMVKRIMDVVSYEYDDGMNHLIMKKSWKT